MNSVAKGAYHRTAFYVTRHLVGRSASNVAWIGSVQLGLLFLTGVAVGKAFDEGYFQYV